MTSKNIFSVGYDYVFKMLIFLIPSPKCLSHSSTPPPLSNQTFPLSALLLLPLICTSVFTAKTIPFLYDSFLSPITEWFSLLCPCKITCSFGNSSASASTTCSELLDNSVFYSVSILIISGLGTSHILHQMYYG